MYNSLYLNQNKNQNLIYYKTELNISIALFKQPNAFKYSKLTNSPSPSKDYVYYFKGIVCYWGSHYFIHMRKDNQWIQLNDTYIKVSIFCL